MNFDEALANHSIWYMLTPLGNNIQRASVVDISNRYQALVTLTLEEDQVELFEKIMADNKDALLHKSDDLFGEVAVIKLSSKYPIRNVKFR